MLDAILNSDNYSDIDWLHVQKWMNQSLTRLLNFFIPFLVFLTPLMLWQIGYASQIIRQLAFLILVVLGWLIWLLRAVVARESIQWKKSALGHSAAFFMAAIVLSMFFSEVGVKIIGLDGVFRAGDPLTYLAIILFALLIVQELGVSVSRLRILVYSYLLSSSALALIIFGAWLFSAGGGLAVFRSIPEAGLWFGLNMVMALGVMLSMRGAPKTIWTAVIFLHLAVLFIYDYNGAWYVVLFGVLAWMLIQTLNERVLARTDFVTPLVIAALCLIFLFAPLRAISDKIGQDANSYSIVSSDLIRPRLFEHVLPENFITGKGLGLSAEQFWSLAEFVDFLQIRSMPPLGNGYLVLLWGGGLLALLTFLYMCARLGYASIRYFPKMLQTRSAKSLEIREHFGLSVFVCFVIWLAVFWFLPVNFMNLFSLAVIVGILAAVLPVDFRNLNRPAGEKEAERTWHFARNAYQKRMWQLILILIFALFVIMIAMVARRVSSRIKFLGSINSDSRGVSVDFSKLDEVIDGNEYAPDFRLSRIGFAAKFIENYFKQGSSSSFSGVALMFNTINTDASFVSRYSLSGPSAWQMAANIELASIYLTGNKEAAEQNFYAETWFKGAKKWYVRAIELLPRNVILFTDVARFYRERAKMLLEKGEDESVYYARAHELLNRALAIDPSSLEASIEKSKLFELENKPQEALDAIKPFVDQGANLAYEAGKLAFSLKDFEQASLYYQSAIERNVNHLQARYDLIQVYIALSDIESAKKELEELDSRVAQEDVSTRLLLDSLREVIYK